MLQRACVIGAGPIGLSTALNLRQGLPQLFVTLIADRFSPHTTGDVAAGLITPHGIFDTPIHKIRQWVSATQSEAQRLFYSPEAKDAGAQYLPVIILFQEKEKDPPYKDVFDGFRHLSRRELDRYDKGLKVIDGWTYSTYMIECWKYLPWLLEKFRREGGHIVTRKVERLEELYDDYDIVINCAGYGAGRLSRDASLQPIRGQTIRVKAPWIKQFTVLGETYIGPGSENVVLGGTYQIGDSNEAVDESDGSNIWRNCRQLMPSLEKAQIESHQVGLRPARFCVRLESEVAARNGRKVLLVHNYGHGGSGVTLHWGCALEAVDLVRQGLGQLRSSQAKL